MLFNSIEFLLFFPSVVACYFLIPQRYRWILLLTASYYFYAAWKVEYLALIVVSTLLDYYFGLRMGQQSSRKARRPYLVLSLLSNLGLLFAFKYLNFFSESLQALFDTFNLFYNIPTFDLLLPVGISFYTFQTLAYTIDVYRGKKEPERHLGIFALYVSFFPQLVAGPIERSQHLLPQFRQRHSFSYERVTDGLKLMLWGFFKKIVIADRLALYVNAVYNNPGDHEGLSVLVATYFFAFQIYCDFSAYTDIARGAAKVLGYDLMENFRRPYVARSVAEFWQRWHISLSTWFRDYLYIPLGGNRVAHWRWQFNIFIVFLVSGLWHGANWTFVVWGALHGSYMLIDQATYGLRTRFWAFLGDTSGDSDAEHKETGVVRRPRIRTLRSFLAVFLTFHLVTLAWVFFRANNLGDAITLLQSIAVFDGPTSLYAWLFVSSISPYEVLLGILFIRVMLGIEGRQGILIWSRRKPTWLRWAIYYAIFFAILMFGEFSSEEFIYFQF